MPIQTKVPIERVSQSKFHTMNEMVMASAFRVHSELGGSDKVVQPIEIVYGGNVLGTQKIRMLNRKTAFKITAATKNINYYKKDLLRFLSHSKLKSVQWINLNHHNIEFRTLVK